MWWLICVAVTQTDNAWLGWTPQNASLVDKPDQLLAPVFDGECVFLVSDIQMCTNFCVDCLYGIIYKPAFFRYHAIYTIHRGRMPGRNIV